MLGPYLLVIFCSGLGLGIVATLLGLGFLLAPHFLGTSFRLPPAAAPQIIPTTRLRAYLHERSAFSCRLD